MAKGIVEFTDANFDAESAKGVVIADFSASWCGPCRMLTPVLEQVAGEMQGQVTIGKIDIDNETKISSRFQISSVPTLILFKEGKEVGRLVGLQTADALKKWIASAK
ncbi:MAG TPA: thioredoxin [Chlamydiales bacterium]|nr:thioredoxin [Chlamydiales bacterium]